MGELLTVLIDGHGRKVDYLRISVTERCNFRCQYCMPEKPFSWVPHENLLSYEDMFAFVKVAIDEGVQKSSRAIRLPSFIIPTLSHK